MNLIQNQFLKLYGILKIMMNKKLKNYFFIKMLLFININIFKLYLKMNNLSICDLITTYGIAVLLNSDINNKILVEIIYEKDNKFNYSKYDNSKLIENKIITTNEIVNVISQYNIAYINNIEYILFNGSIVKIIK